MSHALLMTGRRTGVYGHRIDIAKAAGSADRAGDGLHSAEIVRVVRA